MDKLVNKAIALSFTDGKLNLVLDKSLKAQAVWMNAIAKIITHKTFSRNMVRSILSRAWNLNKSWSIKLMRGKNTKLGRTGWPDWTTSQRCSTKSQRRRAKNHLDFPNLVLERFQAFLFQNFFLFKAFRLYFLMFN